MELVRHSATARYGPQLIQANGVSSHFVQCTEVLKTTPIYRLARCPSLGLLPATVRMLEDHLTTPPLERRTEQGHTPGPRQAELARAED